MSQLELQIVDVPPEPAHRFPQVSYHGIKWDLSHLDSFAFRVDLGLGSDITVLVLFSCHCFSHSLRWDERASHAIPDHEIYADDKERRVLNPKRYELSRLHLRSIVGNLPSRHVTIADERQPNFVTLEDLNANGTTTLYAIFFEVEKDKSRKCRLVLRIQSAYVLDNGLTKRQAKAGKVTFHTLLRAAYLGRKIRG